jgi:hypothetical protein
MSFTYGHSQLKTGHPVRSAIHKQLNGRLVLRWVTTWESLLLYVSFCWQLTRAAMDRPDTARNASVSISNLPGSCRNETNFFCSIHSHALLEEINYWQPPNLLCPLIRRLLRLSAG